MSQGDGFHFYSERGGHTLAVRGLELPSYDETVVDDDPSLYLAGKGLSDAVNVALLLGQPLLVTGEPGTGKTRLADSVAHQFGVPLLKFHTKSTSAARDLFYRYDALRHFHDAQFEKQRQGAGGQADGASLIADPYITYEALGLAILLTMGRDDPQRRRVNEYLPERLRGVEHRRSVVLIDEIDKAPRDLPNDILNEIDQMSFEVKEIDAPPFRAEQRFRPVVVLTSNSEKNLPDAFLRRCVFYHIEFPGGDRLRDIVGRRLGPPRDDAPPRLRENAIKHFERIRKLKLKKSPATAELLAWVRMLERMGLDAGKPALTPAEEQALVFTYSILAKSREDVNSIKKELHPDLDEAGRSRREAGAAS
jgi:MoxR-like ATPase